MPGVKDRLTDGSLQFWASAVPADPKTDSVDTATSKAAAANVRTRDDRGVTLPALDMASLGGIEQSVTRFSLRA